MPLAIGEYKTIVGGSRLRRLAASLQRRIDGVPRDPERKSIGFMGKISERIKLPCGRVEARSGLGQETYCEFSPRRMTCSHLPQGSSTSPLDPQGKPSKNSQRSNGISMNSRIRFKIRFRTACLRSLRMSTAATGIAKHDLTGGFSQNRAHE